MTSQLVSCCDQFKPLSQRITQGLRQGIDVPQNDVEGERELVHVRADLWHLPGTLEYGHLDVQDRILRHKPGLTYSRQQLISIFSKNPSIFFTHP